MEKKQESDETNKDFGKRVAFFAGMTGMAALGGFAMMLSRTRNSPAGGAAQKSVGNAPAMESGASLALRALGRATIYAVGGFSLFCYVSWKLIGAKDLKEFSEKLGHAFPRVRGPREPEEVDWNEILYGSSDKKSSEC